MVAPNLQPQAEKKILFHLIPFMFNTHIEHCDFIFLLTEKKKKNTRIWNVSRGFIPLLSIHIK